MNGDHGYGGSGSIATCPVQAACPGSLPSTAQQGMVPGYNTRPDPETAVGTGPGATGSPGYADVPEEYDYVAKTHLDGANYSFMDGHVKWLRLEKISTAKANGSNFSFWLY